MQNRRVEGALVLTMSMTAVPARARAQRRLAHVAELKQEPPRARDNV